MGNQPLTKELVLERLRKVLDPELQRDIVALGMVRNIDIHGSQVLVELEGPASLDVQTKIKDEVKESLKGLAGMESLTVEMASAKKAASAFSPKMPVSGIDRVIAVASGKGGVGKSTVAVNLALALSAQGARVGLMDGDIYGPNVPLMLGIPAESRPHVNAEGKIIPLEAYGIKMISMGVLVPADQPMVWRGPMLHSAIQQFIQKVAWGELDYLLVDLPPGTGDVQLSLVQTVPLSGAVIVTTPQEVALMDVRKGIMMFQKTEVPILGIIENMSGEIFGRGGGKAAAEQFNVPFLGEIPLDARVREGGDAGKPVLTQDRALPASKALWTAAEALTRQLDKVSA